MIRRFSSRLQKLDASFINERLKGAITYDRIAGYFRSSMLEVAGEKLEEIGGNVRVVCNSDIDPEDAKTAKAAQQALRRSWCEGNPEKLGEPSKDRFSRLYQFIKSGKLEIRVLPDEAFGLVHGKVGVIQYIDESQTCFMGSTNESLSAWKLNYELVWEDDSIEAVKWAQDEFDALWFHPLAIALSDFVISDIKRLAHRSEIDVANGEIENAKKLIDSVKPKHPFDERYNQITEIDWDSCSNVLNADEKRKILLNEW